MPVQSWGHSQYWTASDTSAGPGAPLSGVPGYPLWQSGVVVMPSLFGAIAGLSELWWARLKILWTLTTRLVPMDDEQRAVVFRVVDAVDSPAWPVAAAAVRRTATTLGLNRAENWGPLKAELKRDPGNAENTMRHLNTVLVLRQNYLQSTLSNPQAHLLVELAYQGFAIKGR